MNSLIQATLKGQELDRLEFQQERADHCGDWVSFPDPATGQFKSRIFHCDLWRLCADCLARRAEDVKNRLQRGLHEAGEKIYLVTVATDIADSVMNKVRYRKMQYLRLPVQNAVSIFFEADCKQIEAFEEFNPLIVRNADCFSSEGWEHVSSTPEGMRTSGSLGRPQEEEIPAGTIAVEIARNFSGVEWEKSQNWATSCSRCRDQARALRNFSGANRRSRKAGRLRVVRQSSRRGLVKVRGVATGLPDCRTGQDTRVEVGPLDRLHHLRYPDRG